MVLELSPSVVAISRLRRPLARSWTTSACRVGRSTRADSKSPSVSGLHRMRLRTSSNVCLDSSTISGQRLKIASIKTPVLGVSTVQKFEVSAPSSNPVASAEGSQTIIRCPLGELEGEFFEEPECRGSLWLSIFILQILKPCLGAKEVPEKRQGKSARVSHPNKEKGVVKMFLSLMRHWRVAGRSAGRPRCACGRYG